MGEMKNEYATLDTVSPEADLHIKGTIPRAGGKLEFWMFNPPYGKGAVKMRCGICKGDMSGFRHCPNCFPNTKEE